MKGNSIVGLPATQSNDSTSAASRGYVDAYVQGLNIKMAVKASTTGSITLSGAQTLDGISCVAGDRVLVRHQSPASGNGIYIVRSGASPAWTRADDFDAPSEARGAFVFVQQGTTWADTGWVVISDSIATIGTDDINWTQFSAAGVITNGTGLSKTSSSGGQTTIDLTTAYASTGGTAPNYTLAISNYPSTLASLTGYSIKFKAHASGSGTIRLAVNGTTSTEVRTSDNLNVNSITIDMVYTVVYNGSNFILQGEGGEINVSSKAIRTVKVDEAVNRGDVIESYYRDFTTGFNGTAFSTSGITFDTTITGLPSVVKWSPNGLYLAVGYSATPFFAIFKRNGDSFTRLPASTNVSAGTASEPLSIAWSSDSSSIIVCFPTTPFIYHYKRYSGDYFFRDTMTNPGNPTIVDIDSTNTYIIAATNVSPFVRLLKRGTQDFTLLATSFVANAGGVLKGLSFHPNGNYFACFTDGQIMVQKKSTTTDNFSSVFTVGLGGLFNVLPNAIKWSPDGSYLAVTQRNDDPLSTSDQLSIQVYSFSSDSLSQIFSTSFSSTTISTNFYDCVSWSPDGNYLIASGTLVKPLMIKKNANNTFTLCDTYSTTTTSYRFTDWSPDGNYVATGNYATASYPEIRKVVPANAPYLFRKVSSTSNEVGTFDRVFAVARQAGTANSNIQASVIVGSANTPS
jgi:hypothetical protein